MGEIQHNDMDGRRPKWVKPICERAETYRNGTIEDKFHEGAHKGVKFYFINYPTCMGGAVCLILFFWK